MEPATLKEVNEWINLVEADVHSPLDIEILKFLVHKADQLEVNRYFDDDGNLIVDAVDIKIGDQYVTWSVWEGFEFPHDALCVLWAAIGGRNPNLISQ